MKSTEISIVIPARNEQEHIGGVLKAIDESIDGRLDYEVLVVDNGSSDRTLAIALEHGAICLEAANCTISTVRNVGAAHARADILVFLDADVYLGKDWGKRIKSVSEKLQRQSELITGSFCGISAENNWIEKIWFAPRITSNKAAYMNSGHLIIHRKLFARLGGFAAQLETGEDSDLCSRAKRLGAHIENDPTLQVMHAGYPKSIGHFFRRERWHARGDCRSLGTMMVSKPALLSLANIIFIAVCCLGILIYPRYWSVFAAGYAVFLGGVSLAAAIHRCRCKSGGDLFGVALLYVVYIAARTVSILDVLLTRRRGAKTREDLETSQVLS